MIRGTVAPLIEMGAGFNPELSGRDNILLNGAMLGIKPKEMRKRSTGIYEFTGLREFADTPAQILFERDVRPAGVRHRHRGGPRDPADRRVARRRAT